MKLTQEQFVMEQLKTQGFISRNQCLANYITRLSSIIFNLKRQGYVFDTYQQGNIKPDGTLGKDFIYRLIKKHKEHVNDFGEWETN